MTITTTRPRIRMLKSGLRMIDQRTAPTAPTTGTNAIYWTPEWRALVKRLKRERGNRCEDPECEGPHSSGQRVHGDHIVEIADGGAKLDPRNVMLRCSRSHGKKTAKKRQERYSAPILKR